MTNINNNEKLDLMVDRKISKSEESINKATDDKLKKKRDLTDTSFDKSIEINNTENNKVEIKATDTGLVIEQNYEDGSKQLFTFPTQGGELAISTPTIKTLRINDSIVAGDGSDVSTILQKLIDSEKWDLIVLEPNSSYGLNEQLVIPKNTNIKTNGAIFKKLNSSTKHAIKLSGNNCIDYLVVDMVGGGLEDRAIYAEGKINCVSITVNSTVDDYESGGVWAIELQDSIGSWIGELNTKSVANTLFARNCSGLRVDSGVSDTYRIAYYLQDVKHSEFNNIHCHTTSKSSSGIAGENGFLVESLTHKGSTNIVFNNCVVEDSGEHAYRLGGQKTIENIYFNNCTARRSGSSIKINNPKAVEWHGGCGFKILGATSVLGEKHKNIYLNNCAVYDINIKGGSFPNGHGSGNYAGIQIAVSDGVHLNNVKVAKEEQEYSSMYGVEILASENVYINNTQIEDTWDIGIRIYSADEGYVGWTTPSKNINMYNTKITSRAAAIEIKEGVKLDKLKLVDCFLQSDTVWLFRNYSNEVKDAYVKAECVPSGKNFYDFAGIVDNIVTDLLYEDEPVNAFKTKDGSTIRIKSTGSLMYVKGRNLLKLW